MKSPQRSRSGENRNPLRLHDDEHPWRGIHGRGAYADRKEANYRGRPVRILHPVTKTDLERIRREIARETA